MNTKRAKSGAMLSKEGLSLQSKLIEGKSSLAHMGLDFVRASKWSMPFCRISRTLMAWQFRIQKKQVEWFAKEAKKKLSEAGVVGAESDDPAVKLSDIIADSNLRCSNTEWENSMDKAYDDLMRFVTFYCNKLENARL